MNLGLEIITFIFCMLNFACFFSDPNSCAVNGIIGGMLFTNLFWLCLND